MFVRRTVSLTVVMLLLGGWVYRIFVKHLSDIVTDDDLAASHPAFERFVPRDNVNNTPRGIILHSKYRAGSTFASAFFSKNKDFFFAFEPLNLLSLHDRLLEAEDVLRKVFACDFDGLRESMLKSMWYWLKSQLVCYSDQTPGCPNVTRQQAQDYCKQADQVVTKVIRIQDLSSIANLMRQGHKVVHVLRDPRATMSSRGSLHGTLKSPEFSSLAFNEMQRYCKSSMDDFDLISKALRTSDPMAQSYMFFRYEDLALNPLWGLRAAYDFLGFPPDESVRQWAGEQHHKLKGNHTTARQVDRSLQNDAYSTERSNPSKMVDHWRRKMPFEIVEVIQVACKDFMERVGYVPMTSPDGVANTTQPTFIAMDKTPLHNDVLRHIYT